MSSIAQVKNENGKTNLYGPKSKLINNFYTKILKK